MAATYVMALFIARILTRLGGQTLLIFSHFNQTIKGTRAYIFIFTHSSGWGKLSLPNLKLCYSLLCQTIRI